MKRVQRSHPDHSLQATQQITLQSIANMDPTEQMKSRETTTEIIHTQTKRKLTKPTSKGLTAD